MIRLTLSDVYSLRNMADKRPNGIATNMAIRDVRVVPRRRGSIPNFLVAKSGVHSRSVRKAIIETSLKKEAVSNKRVRSIPSVTRIERIPHKKSMACMAYSPIIECFFLLIIL